MRDCLRHMLYILILMSRRPTIFSFFFFLNDPAPTEISPLPLHAPLPICSRVTSLDWASYPILRFPDVPEVVMELISRPNEPPWGVGEPAACLPPPAISNAVFDAVGVRLDRKSTRLNSSHGYISYAVFCLK